MKTRNLILIAATAAIVVWAWQVTVKNAPTVNLSATNLFPALIEQVNDVETITIKSANDVTRLSKVDTLWTVTNRDAFPAKFEKVKQVILKLAETRIIEQKTSLPAKYESIGVNDPSDGDSEGTRVDLAAASGEALASLIIGKQRQARAAGIPNYYVRRVEDAASYLVEGELDISARIDEWLDSDVVDIDTDRVRRVTIKPNGDDPIVIQKSARSANFLELQDIPSGFKAKSRATVSSIGALLLGLRFEDVADAAKVADDTPRSSIEMQTFDGLTATIDQYDYQDSEYVKLSFSYDESLVVTEQTTEETAEADTEAEQPEMSVADEVAALTEKTKDWIYVLPDYKQRMLGKRLGDLIEPIEEEQDSAEGS